MKLKAFVHSKQVYLHTNTSFLGFLKALLNHLLVDHRCIAVDPHHDTNCDTGFILRKLLLEPALAAVYQADEGILNLIRKKSLQFCSILKVDHQYIIWDFPHVTLVKDVVYNCC